MTIKNRLALYFTSISTASLLIVLVAIYVVFVKFLENDFYRRLEDRARISANVFLEADEMSTSSLKKVRSQYLEKLTHEIVKIYNDRNEAVFIEDDEQYWTTKTIDLVRNKQSVRFREGNTQVVGLFYKDNQGDFVILVSAVDQSSIYRVGKLRNIMIIAFLVISIGLLISANWIANRILKPLDRFIDDVKHIKSNNLDFRVSNNKTKDEIELLAQNFNELMEHLEQAFILQRTFISNASHELRTPITSMLMGAEIALSKERSVGEYQETLTSVVEDAEKMNAIIKELLHLAQTDIDLGSAKLQELEVATITAQLEKDWRSNEHELKIINDAEPSLKIYVNRTLLQIAINNIVANAFKFSENKAVVCQLEQNNNWLEISIIDEGVGIESTVLDKIFNPFYTTSNSKYKGNGMGLYMAKRIAILFKGTLTVTSVSNEGSTFKLSLPAF